MEKTAGRQYQLRKASTEGREGGEWEKYSSREVGCAGLCGSGVAEVEGGGGERLLVRDSVAG